jgi:acetyl esterase/lipase
MVAYTAGKTHLEPAEPYPGVSSRVGAVINMYGITNVFTRVVTDETGRPTDQPRHFVDAERTFGPDRTTWHGAMPVNHVDASSPPTLILHGRADTTVDYLQAIELARVLDKHGVRHELRLIDGIGHTFNLATWGRKPLPQDLTTGVLEFLGRHMPP